MTGPVLLTGSNGFLGAWIIARLVAAGHDVVATDIDRDFSRLKALLPDPPMDRIAWRSCDVTDGGAVEAIVSETGPSAIIHLAALQIPQCRGNPVLGAKVNIIGHLNIMEAARIHGVRRVIYTSSIAAKPRGEANAPANLYGVYKKTDEEIARLYWEDHGVPSLGLRPHIVYGVGRDQGETSAITTAIRAAALGEAYEMPFRTESCFQYAGDVAEMFVRAAASDWEGALLSDLTSRVETTSDIRSAITSVVPDAHITLADESRLSPVAGFDTEPLQRIIGPLPDTSLEKGVAETVEIFRRNALAG
ncbi:NAD-dependent epimerase/dehydratase family protein [Oricola indica]|uniref:NAD-dependent epimerase/dehydratase family protein n=1 Tax=Oricola indica TaxID=2872591 RepID=UPI003CCC35A0